MKLIDEVQVFSLSEVVSEKLWLLSPKDAEEKAKEWCSQNNAVFGQGDLPSLVELVKSSGKEKVVLAEL